LFPEAIENIHNRAAVSEFANSVWFKRYWLTAHDMVNRSRKDIVAVNEDNNSERIFYYFIAKLYELNQQTKSFYYQAVNFLQEKYELFPAHLRNKCLLYERLFLYYSREESGNPARVGFCAFL
jgi:hypothetical protein